MTETIDYRVIVGDSRQVLKTLDADSVDCVVTSPPYWGLRDYQVTGQLGQEEDVGQYIDDLVSVFHDAKRLLKPDGSLWVNIADTYHDKSLMGIPWLLAFAMKRNGWYLRNDIIWHKTNGLPESVKDRFTRNHEYLFFFTKNSRYYFDQEAVREPAKETSIRRYGNARHYSKWQHIPGMDNANSGIRDVSHDTRNKCTVWSNPVNSVVIKDHFAVYPEKLIEPCILSCSRPGGLVLDPFNGSGTTGVVSVRNMRNYIGVELNPKFAGDAYQRIKSSAPQWFS